MKEKADFCFDGERSARVFVRRQTTIFLFRFSFVEPHGLGRRASLSG